MNGWKNRETWTLAVWLYNDEAFLEGAIQAVWEAEDLPYHRMKALRAWIESVHEPTGLVADLFNVSLDRVDWDAITDSLLESYRHTGHRKGGDNK